MQIDGHLQNFEKNHDSFPASEGINLFLCRKAETKSTIASKSVINADDDNLSAAKSPSQQTSKDGRRHTKGQGSDTISRSRQPANKSPSRERTLDALKRKQKVSFCLNAVCTKLKSIL